MNPIGVGAPRQPSGSDFLSRLVDRARGTGAGLEPRRRSRFEPAVEAEPPGAWPTLDAGEVLEERETKREGVLEPGRRSPAPLRPEVFASPAASRDREPASPAILAARQAPSDEPDGGDELPEIRRPVEAADEPAEGSVRSARMDPEPPITTTPPAPSPIDFGIDEASDRSDSTGRVEPPVLEIVSVRRVSEAPRVSEPGRGRARRAEAPREHLARATARPAAERSEPIDEAAAPPAIQVTIGRIEVRALPAPASSAHPPKSRGPRLSLEDYLGARSRGGS